jgi:cation:H+ antiporter
LHEYAGAILLILVGLVAVIGGGELLVRGASALATAVRVSPLVIGLTVVAFGTSAPELAITVRSCYQGQTDLAVGNVVGSSIFNVLFVLGFSALVAPLVVSARLIQWDVPLMILASVLVFVFGLDGRIGRTDGLIFVTGLLAYTGWSIWQSRRENKAVAHELETRGGEPAKRGWWRIPAQFGLIAAGLALLVLGSKWLVDGAVEVARLWGVSELMIGLTILAVGTSLPEAAVSVTASIRGEREIAVGNVVGSNLLNILAVLGITGIVAPGGVEVSAAALWFDVPVMITVAVACLPIFFTGHRIARWEGCLFVGYYVLYTAYLIMNATESEIRRPFEVAMLGVVIPLTAITLLASALGYRRSRAGRP